MDDKSRVVTTTEDARAVIEKIARHKGTFTDAFRQKAKEEAENGDEGKLEEIEGREELREDLASALKIISKDLYTSRARFLMEVIQNADDNEYDEGISPTVSITVSPKHVMIECNEDGFSKDNIMALCRTGRSSKQPGQGYTGEKGIGFKSVFKLAERAHIRSPPYFFQLDQTRQLGMITPQWDRDFFDDYEEQYQTTIVLDHICDQSTDFSTALQEDLEAIDPVLILFLRRIKRLHLTLIKSQYGEPTISKRLKLIDRTPGSGIISLKDEHANTFSSFYKHGISIPVKGTEARRPNVAATDIVLAFPVRRTESGAYIPAMRKQNFVFAYLPIGNFGFKFIIQADFLTTSNRQSVDEDSPWNKNIATAIPRAFEVAIKNFNSDESSLALNELAKSWPLYLDSDTIRPSKYWSSIANSIYSHLRNSAIIRDRTGGVRKPSGLMFLDWAVDRKGEPIFGDMHDFVSSIYPDSVREALLLLGVTVPTWSWVCDRLQELHEQGLLHSRLESKEWCLDLAKVILKPEEPKGNSKYARDLGKLPLIPLSDGTWRCPPSEDDPIYFPASWELIIPAGLELSLLHKEACESPERRKLFRLLGVKYCDVPNVVKRILDYHASPTSAENVHFIAQLKYLYKMQEHLQPGDMDKVYFVCSASEDEGRQHGSSTYADISEGRKLRDLFSGYSKAHFLDEGYFAELDGPEKVKLAEWLRETAGVALAPRLIATHSKGLHEDFKWLLNHQSHQILRILKQHWNLYNKNITRMAKDALDEIESHEFRCLSGDSVALRQTYLPLPNLMEKVRLFGDTDDFDFLDLPSGRPKDWTFLSSLGVGLDDGLDFYLWVLNQIGSWEKFDVEKSKQLYLAIQERVFSPPERDKVRKAFGDASADFPNDRYEPLKGCVWQGPKGYSSKPALQPVYGSELNKLFPEILQIPNATISEALEYLEELRSGDSATIVDVAEVYVFIKDFCAEKFAVDDKSACIAVPSSSTFVLEWKTPAQCVWDDDEFSRVGLELESKTAIKRAVEQHAPTTVAFFTDVLKLPNAGINDLLADLALMPKKRRTDAERVYRLYEGIESHRRKRSETIMKAFKNSSLVLLRGIDGESDKWLSLDDCTWTRSVLRDKYPLMPSLKQYRGLFKETLRVPDVTSSMVIDELLNLPMEDPMEDDEGYQYVKTLLREIARLWRTDQELELDDETDRWPCRTPTCPRELREIGSFYVNDRQDLFDIFSGSHAFLDFDFGASREISDLLRYLGCDMFLSEKVSIETEYHAPLEQDDDLTQDFRGRAYALIKYIEHAGCKPPHDLRLLLQNVEVWESADIKTHYTLDGTTVTKREGGSCVKVSRGKGPNAKLGIYLSMNKDIRECALITDFPGQLVAALEIEGDLVPDIHTLLQVRLVSLNALLVRKGITGGNPARDFDEISAADSDSEESQRQTNGSSEDGDDGASSTLASDTRSGSEESVVVESTRASARSEAADTIRRPHLDQRPNSRPVTPQRRRQDNPNVISDESHFERAVSPQPATASPYSMNHRNRNRERIQSFARDVKVTSSSRPRRPVDESGTGDPFDLSALRESLAVANPRRRARQIPDRNEEERARDFEVGFLGEEFVYTLLRDTLHLPDFTGDDNWTSSLRSRAGFSRCKDDLSDFTYKDSQGALTRYFLQMNHPYETPEWLSGVCEDGNVPLYRLEVKSTTSQDPTTTFYMSNRQYKLAKRLSVTSARPSEIYVILRISGLDALEFEGEHRPQLRVYLDPYTRGQEGGLDFNAPTYAVTATA